MQNKLFDLSGRIALVTGGSKGLGAAMARAFAMAGADVVICSRHEDELEAAAAGIRARRFHPTPGYQTCRYCAYNQICPSTATRE